MKALFAMLRYVGLWVSWVRNVLLWDSGKVDNSVRDRISTTKCDDDTRIRRRMGDGNVAARIGHELAGVPCLATCRLVCGTQIMTQICSYLEKFKVRKFRAATEAFERL